jgi:hypothetical protein
LSACGDHVGDVDRRALARARSELCVAAGTWSAATHYKEHVRRPDPLEGHNLTTAQSRADRAVFLFQETDDSSGLNLAKRLASGDERFRRAYQTELGLVAAEAQIVAVLGDLPASCVLSSRTNGPS